MYPILVKSVVGYSPLKMKWRPAWFLSYVIESDSDGSETFVLVSFPDGSTSTVRPTQVRFPNLDDVLPIADKLNEGEQ